MQAALRRMAKISVIAFPLVGLACSDDTVTGPQFGDLEFTPGFIDLEQARQTSSILSNEGDVPLGSISIAAAAGIGIGGISSQVCPEMQTFVSPATVATLAPGGSTQVNIVVDLSAVGPADCPDGSYDIDVTASVSGLGLAFATVRIDYTGQN